MKASKKAVTIVITPDTPLPVMHPGGDVTFIIRGNVVVPEGRSLISFAHDGQKGSSHDMFPDGGSVILRPGASAFFVGCMPQSPTAQ